LANGAVGPNHWRRCAQKSAFDLPDRFRLAVVGTFNTDDRGKPAALGHHLSQCGQGRNFPLGFAPFAQVFADHDGVEESLIGGDASDGISELEVPVVYAAA
jgi:hypothetical protein